MTDQEPGDDRPRLSQLAARAQQTGTAPAALSVATVALFAALALMVGTPSILDGQPQIAVLLVALAMTLTLLADLLRPELGRHALWLRLLGLVVASATLVLLSLHLWA